ncbi:D-methionine transport system ATP-binding protein [Kocuria rhizophila]|uniref:Putative ABC transporter ATP-binding protein n=1 Tax=Kocuria rhizophila (strain ATCC 9341 / DSM 348 / NBRC 103217 / DC2201) TaxID=378753 RepID=B2GKS5_KOCRD|nr:methionine ABC transporter ATP-binding protein [Kocuria rhizophila]ASE12230.1 methionine ABC transporter ATP-binding protein [Kocuria rhizophila]MBK4119904.1 methionine ABC transporter ATP-binding protein [Kocuria rhizophila]MCC5674143.1 methionine ABC transporter ATP-binding protein [Kocuria rhizophila]MDV5999506.1 methionine ABC transporter ATP-binding protein [Kocuria rhizophila]VEH74765.1 Methionine import ATP-binding protein MetN [Kocuria rhizophila]
MSPASTADALVRFKDVSKVFTTGSRRRPRTVTAVDSVNLEIRRGEVFAVIGYSGAGKSTLVRLINGLEPVTSGSLEVAGQRVDGRSETQLAPVRRDIGMIFQQFNLFTSRTVAGNIEYPLRRAGWKAEDRKARVAELLEFVGLTERAGNYPEQLSGGQKQRVGIARALATSPELLLADESTSALDPETTQEVLGLLRRVNRELGITIVLITHEMDVVRAVADRVAVMDGGRVVETGTTAEVFAHPQAETTRRFVSSVMRTVPREDELAKLRSEHPGRLVLVDVADRNRIGTALSEAARDGVSFEIAFGGISILQSHTFGTLTLSLDGPEDAVSRAVEALRAVTTVQEVSE